MLAPAYGTGSLADLGESVLGAIGVPDAANPLGLPPSSRIVVLVLDGVGTACVRDHADAAPFLRRHLDRTLTSVFPSTTATALTSIATASPPGQHGLLGYTVGLPGHARPLNLLGWSWGPPSRARDARDEIVPERFQPVPTIFERAAALGVATFAVSHPDHRDSGLTRAILRGADYLDAAEIEATVEVALEAVSRAPRTLVYAHHGAVDTAAHLLGLGSDGWLAALRRADDAVAGACERLGDDVLFIVTADHGMVDVPRAGLIELDGDLELEAGVRVLAGEPRSRQLHVVAGARDDVASTWAEVLGDRFTVVTRDAAVEAGWFGAAPIPEALVRAGDVLAVAIGDGALVHRRWDPFGGRLAAMHGALTPAEVEVPLAVLGPAV